MDIVEAIVGLMFGFYCVYWIGLIIYFYTGTVIFIAIVGYIVWQYFKKDETLPKVDYDRTSKSTDTKISNIVKIPAQSPNPNPYALEELQDHLNAYRQKAINSGNRDKWKYGRDYERYVGYLLEEKGWKVIYNGAVKGNFDGGIDLICYKGNKCCLIQCKRWKNNVGAEYIERFYDAVERFKINYSGCYDVKGVFYTTSDYTDDAYDVALEYDIECHSEKFDSILEYPSVKCLIRDGEKIYYLPFDKEFDEISAENGCEYKFKVADAERAGYHYHLNRDILLKTGSTVVLPKKTKTIQMQIVSKSTEQTTTSKAISTPKVLKSVEPPKVPPFPMIDYYWKGNKNYPAGYFHAGYFEFIDLKSCRILTTYTDDKIKGTAYILQATFISVVLLELPKYKENFRVFRYFKNFPILPEVYVNNYWESIPEYRELNYGELIAGGEGYLSYIENQKMYEYTMFKIVHYKLFGEEYADSCKYGWHYDKGYPEYR